MKTTEHKNFKPFDKVLTKYGNVWIADTYSNYIQSEELHLTYRGAFRDYEILPYEGNEHLVGTPNEPEEEIKLQEGEWIVAFDNLEKFNKGEAGAIRLFRHILENWFQTDGWSWNYAIRFSDFNPNDMEETRKHILCVKNGKVVRYKE